MLEYRCVRLLLVDGGWTAAPGEDAPHASLDTPEPVMDD
jgi:hypothetical protein